MDATTTNKKNRKPALVAAALGLVLALVASPVAIKAADAAATDGGCFAIGTSLEGGKFTGEHGRVNCGGSIEVPAESPIVLKADSCRVTGGASIRLLDVAWTTTDESVTYWEVRKVVRPGEYRDASALLVELAVRTTDGVVSGRLTGHRNIDAPKTLQDPAVLTTWQIRQWNEERSSNWIELTTTVNRVSEAGSCTITTI